MLPHKTPGKPRVIRTPPGGAIDAPTPPAEGTGPLRPPRYTAGPRGWRPACSADAPSPVKRRQKTRWINSCTTTVLDKLTGSGWITLPLPDWLEAWFGWWRPEVGWGWTVPALSLTEAAASPSSTGTWGQKLVFQSSFFSQNQSNISFPSHKVSFETLAANANEMQHLWLFVGLC